MNLYLLQDPEKINYTTYTWLISSHYFRVTLVCLEGTETLAREERQELQEWEELKERTVSPEVLERMELRVNLAGRLQVGQETMELQERTVHQASPE